MVRSQLKPLGLALTGLGGGDKGGLDGREALGHGVRYRVRTKKGTSQILICWKVQIMRGERYGVRKNL